MPQRAARFGGLANGPAHALRHRPKTLLRRASPVQSGLF